MDFKIFIKIFFVISKILFNTRNIRYSFLFIYFIYLLTLQNQVEYLIFINRVIDIHDGYGPS